MLYIRTNLRTIVCNDIKKTVITPVQQRNEKKWEALIILAALVNLVIATRINKSNILLHLENAQQIFSNAKFLLQLFTAFILHRAISCCTFIVTSR